MDHKPIHLKIPGPHIRESGFRNPGNFCMWNPEYWEFFHVESGILENFACGFRNLGNFRLCNPESWALESGIQLQESGIPLTIGIRNPRSTEKDVESSTWNPEPTKLNPVSKTVLDSLTWGDTRLNVEVLGRAMRTKITLRQEALTELETNPVRHK